MALYSFIRSMDGNILSGRDCRISETLLFGVSSFKDTKNASILNTKIDYILSTERFDVPLTSSWFIYLGIEKMSFKFYYLNIKSFVSFHYIIILGYACSIYFAFSVRVFFQIITIFILVCRLLLCFLFINKRLPVKVCIN